MNQKRRLMFIKWEDYNYLTYNLLIILKYLWCEDINKSFIDTKKIIYLIFLVSDKKYLNILRRVKRIDDSLYISSFDREVLTKLYYEWLDNIKQLNQLLFILDKKWYIGIVKEKSNYNLYIKDNIFLNEMLDSNLFTYEIDNMVLLQKELQRSRTLKFDTFMNNLFYKFWISKCDF